LGRVKPFYRFGLRAWRKTHKEAPSRPELGDPNPPFKYEPKEVKKKKPAKRRRRKGSE
jgi:hypothetical protein